jgi:hypothetical protein
MRAAWVVAAIAISTASAAAQSRADTLPERVAVKQIEAFNRRDLEGFMALYADEIVLAEFPSGRVLATGKAEIRARYAPVFKAGLTPPVRVEPRVVSGSFVVDNEVWDATPGERRRGDVETRRRGDAETWRRGDVETWRRETVRLHVFRLHVSST